MLIGFNSFHNIMLLFMRNFYYEDNCYLIKYIHNSTNVYSIYITVVNFKLIIIIIINVIIYFVNNNKYIKNTVK